MLDWLHGGSIDPGSSAPYRADTDARRVALPLRGDRVDPEAQRWAKLRRGAVIFFVATMLAGGTVAALVGNRGWFDLRRKREEVQSLREAEAVLRREVDSLGQAVSRLESDPSARERVARERLDMARPGEIVFLLPPASEGAAGVDAGDPPAP